MSASTTHARATAVNLDTPVRGSLMINGLENDLILGSDGNIFTIRADGSNKTYLTEEGPEVINHLASWSYDGTKIVYTRGESTPFGRIQPYIWTMNADGTDKKQLTFHPLSGSSPTFSPDGQSILFTTHAGSALADDPLVCLEVWTMKADGTNAHSLTETPIGGYNLTGKVIKWSMEASYSPDGSKIAYSSTLSGSAQIWTMNSDGSDKKRITFIENRNLPQNAPAWSPDGDAIVYAGSDGEDLVAPTINIYKIKPDGSDRTQLTFNEEGLTSDIPAWSPDGEFIYFGSIMSGVMETWVMRKDGSDQQPLFPNLVQPSRLPVTSTTFKDIVPTGSIMGAITSNEVLDSNSEVSQNFLSGDTSFFDSGGDSGCGCDGSF
jgi:Tol biopolymer transport system component